MEGSYRLELSYGELIFMYNTKGDGKKKFIFYSLWYRKNGKVIGEALARPQDKDNPLEVRGNVDTIIMNSEILKQSRGFHPTLKKNLVSLLDLLEKKEFETQPLE